MSDSRRINSLERLADEGDSPAIHLLRSPWCALRKVTSLAVWDCSFKRDGIPHSRQQADKYIQHGSDSTQVGRPKGEKHPEKSVT